MPNDPTDHREPFAGHFFGIFNVEGADPEPLALFNTKALADGFLEACRKLPEDHDDHLDEHHHVFPADLVGVWWNSYDPYPRAEPLSAEETIRAYEGNVVDSWGDGGGALGECMPGGTTP